MKVLDVNDYIKIFMGSLEYDTIEKIKAYFLGVYNKHKECNPLPIYIDGLNKAYNYLREKFDKEYHEQLGDYYRVLQLNPNADIEKPNKYNNMLPAIWFDNRHKGHFTLGMLEYRYKGLESFRFVNNKTSQDSFKSTLTNPQIKKLFKALIDNKYIDKDTIESDFEAVFSGCLQEGHNPIKWIDKAPKRHEPNAKTLFELLFLLKPYIDSKQYDTTASNEANFYRLIENCFANFRNLPEKNPYQALSDTQRKTLLKSIVETL